MVKFLAPMETASPKSEGIEADWDKVDSGNNFEKGENLLAPKKRSQIF